MLNKVFITGRICTDLELRTTASGIPVISTKIAVDRDFKNKQTGERETDFVPCVFWNEAANFVHNYFAKGRMITVLGRLQVRDYTDKENQKRTAVEVIAENVYFADSKPENSGTGTGEHSNTASTKTAVKTPQNALQRPAVGQFVDIDSEGDESLPF